MPSARSSSRTGCSAHRRRSVITHSDCGMLTFTNEDLRAKLQDEAGADVAEMDFLPFSDLEESVRASVRRIRESPFLPDSFAASGFVYPGAPDLSSPPRGVVLF